ncbi:MAG TPA: cell division protein ZapA [Candidatus Hydrogenedentes bacterium]|jgi:cell division protein ZapA (FtsZ GTPase activity inhibitor)|nr:cell division protein ZapA [Candidatus Hydrogenedentota bacterium]
MSILNPKQQVEIAGNRLQVPLYIDEETTEQLAAEISARLKKIGATYETVNTQRNALATAYDYAVETAETKKQYEQDIREILTALERITSSLKELLDRFPPV